MFLNWNRYVKLQGWLLLLWAQHLCSSAGEDVVFGLFSMCKSGGIICNGSPMFVQNVTYKYECSHHWCVLLHIWDWSSSGAPFKVKSHFFFNVTKRLKKVYLQLDSAAEWTDRRSVTQLITHNNHHLSIISYQKSSAHPEKTPKNKPPLLSLFPSVLSQWLQRGWQSNCILISLRFNGLSGSIITHFHCFPAQLAYWQ